MADKATGDDLRKIDLIEGLVEKARWRLGDALTASMEGFIRGYYRGAETEEIAARNADALFGAAYTHWQLAKGRKPGGAAIRVYNPSLENDGWHSDNTVVEIVIDDMAFLVASIFLALSQRDLTLNWVLHPIYAVNLDDSGAVTEILDPRRAPEGTPRVSCVHVEITRQPEAATADIARDLKDVLADVRTAVADWQQMVTTCTDVIEELQGTVAQTDPEALEEACAFLDWLRTQNFTFLGYRAYALRRSEDGVLTADAVTGSGLGLLKDREKPILDDLQEGEPLSPAACEFVLGPHVLTVSKSDRRSRVHRAVQMDTVIVKRFDAEGQVIGGHLFAGLFAAAAYYRSARNIPILRQKVERVMARAGVLPRSHDGRALMNIVENFPRDELFQASEEHLLATSIGILHLQFRPRVAIFLRRDDFERFVACLVYIPRDRYSTAIRQEVHRILAKAYGGEVTTHYGEVGDAPLARLQVFVKTTPGNVPNVEPKHLEEAIHAATRSWADTLHDALVATHGEETGLKLCHRFGSAFPTSYGEAFSVDEAVADIALINQALDRAEIGLHLYRPFAGAEFQMRLKMYHPDSPVVLSSVMPMLEDLGLTVTEEMPYAVQTAGDMPRTVFIHDFGLETRSRTGISIASLRDRFEDAFLKIWHGETECDGFNALVILADLTWREVMLLRAFAKYLRQVGIAFSQDYMEETLGGYPTIARLIVRLFQALFDPTAEEGRNPKVEAIRAEIMEGLDAVENADHDRILRRFINVAESCLRTNYYVTDAPSRHRPYVSFKLNSAEVDGLPDPRPFVEVFVYSPQVEGIHLRAGKVARGGLRWSDRREDFRTEILGLMKAQVVKNAVIVPVGAKGGFVVKKPPTEGGRDAQLAHGVSCYRNFIRGLLDITDNRIGGEIVPPPNVVRRDEDDPYLVVAADKGTATFSDFANEISAEYGFWLGDAFASGGGNGYDHKKMGITAKGAWESVKRHFREIDHDTQTEPFTVVGVGDMSGDVFGNGMLLSRQIKLIAAFNHLHIFVDPDPDPERSFVERERQFNTPQSTWEDYAVDAMSPGGTIFSRRAKQLTLTPEIRALLGTVPERMTPTELIRHLLAAEVDLLWFGGIGTYIKSSTESHADAGDRANDAVRLNAAELRCKVLGEGANLAITQLGRIEFAARGGRLNTDFIDNSAGVDCSDHEVNIKILLDAAVQDGDLTQKQRNALLVDMTDEVSDLVLRDNYMQTQAISSINHGGAANLDSQVRMIRFLERQKRLNREVEDLPDDEELARRAGARQGLTRPEISVLFSYCKIWLYDQILASELPDDRYLAGDAVRYFPSVLHDAYATRIADHRLRRELIATSVTNSAINRVGGPFVLNIMEECGCGPVEVASAYIVARDVFAVRQVWSAIENLDLKITADLQIRLHQRVMKLLEQATLWLLRHGEAGLDIAGSVEAFATPVAALVADVDSLLPDVAKDRVTATAAEFEAEGVPAETAMTIARLALLPQAFDVVRIAAASGRELNACGQAYFQVGEELGFDWLRAQAAAATQTGHWQRLAVSALNDELSAAQARLTETVIRRATDDPPAALADWTDTNQSAISRAQTLVSEFKDAETLDFPMLTVASRYLRTMADA